MVAQSLGELDQIQDPDESGTDTLQRFRYQAEVIFPTCLNLAFVRNIITITPERFEDVLIEETDRWRFVQVKTRNAGLNPFTFADLLGKSGALRSIARTHTALAGFDDGRDIRYEIWLEQGAKSSDKIMNLVEPNRVGPDEEMIKTCTTRLKITEQSAQEMLGRCHILAPHPPREIIRDTNIRNLQRYNPTVAVDVSEAVYDQVINLVEWAMRAELLRDDFPGCILNPEDRNAILESRVRERQITFELLDEILKPVRNGNQAVLEQITDPNQLAATELDRKLVAAGVNEETRQSAKQLRANASRRTYERAAGLGSADVLLEDLDLRLLTYARSTAGANHEDPPGPAVFQALSTILTQQPETIDPSSVLSQDPMFLLGRVCDLSDECLFGWGAEK